MHRRTLTCLALLTLFLFSSVGIFTTNIGTPLSGEPTPISSGGTQIDSTRSPTAPPTPEGPIWDGSEYLYQGLGQTLPSQEFSQGDTATLGVTDLDFGETTSGQIGIPQGWTGYQLTASVYNLFDKISHITGNTRNGNFESGTTSPQYWVQSQRGLPVSDPEIDGLEWNWGTDWGQSGNGINVWANMSSSAYWWTSNATYIEYVGWTQTIDLNRINPTYAWLSFDVRFYDDGVHGRDDDDEMAVYAEVGGVERVFVCHRYCMNARVSGDWSFHNIAFSLTPDELQSWTSDTINVTVGMTVDFDWDVNNYFGMDFDDVELIVRGKVSPTANGIQLRLNSTSSWVNPTYGSGTISLTGTWGPYPSSRNIVATWTTVSAISRNVDFNYTLTLHMKRSKTTEAQTDPQGSAFSVKHGLNASWTAWFFADFYSTYYNNYNFTIKKPAGGIWSLSSVTDPNLDPKTADVLAQSNATYWRLPASIIDAFGWWKFTFTSWNQIPSIIGLETTYRISPLSPSTLSISLDMFSVTSGTANLSIFNEQRELVYNDTDTITGDPHPFPGVTFNDGNKYPAGTYDLCISYNDSIAPSWLLPSQAGFYHATFDIEHDSSLTPETTPLSVSYDGGLTYFYPRVSYNDIDTTGSPFIDNSTGTVTVTGQVSGYPLITFRQSGSLYQAIVPDNYVPPGDHNLQVTANDPFFDSASTTIVLQVRSPTTLSSPTPGYTAYYQETFTLQVYYEDNGGSGIAGAATWFTTPGWTGTVITAGGSAGWYDVEVPTTTDGRIPGTYTLTVTVTDPSDYYQGKTLEFTIVIRGRNTLLTSTTPSSVPYGATAQFSINLSDLDGGPAPTNSTNKLHLSLWRGGVRWTSPEASITFSGTNGKWDIAVDTGFLPGVGDYTFEVRFEWYHISSDNAPFYGNRTVDVTVSARLVGTSITYDPPNPIPINDDADITIYYQVDDPIYFPVSRIFGILKADVTILLNGTNLGTGFDWDPQLDGSYILTIYASDLNQVALWEIEITIDNSGDSYQGASRTFLFNVRKRLTQVIVDPPESTPYQQNTPITFSWYDLDAGSTPIALSSVYQVTISGEGSPQTFTNPGSWTVTLVTNTWSPGTYNLNLLITGDDPPGIYNQTKSAVTVRIRIHYTGVTVQPPDPTPWGMDTDITVIWTDLDTGTTIGVGNLINITVKDGPGGDQVFFGSFTFILDTDLWSVGSYLLNVTVYAVDSPRTYSDAVGSVTVVIRIHRVEVVVPTPSPTPWGQDTGMSVTWKDLDTGTTIDVSNLDNITVSNCPVGGNQVFGTLSFTLDTNLWSVGAYPLTVTVYPDTLPSQLYEIGSYQVTITIRAHYVSVTIDPPAQTPWGFDTDLTVTWRDVDTDTLIAEGNLDNVTVTGGPGGDQSFFTLSFTLSTSGWSVASRSLTVWVYGNNNYVPNSGPVTVVIRGHQTQTVVTPPQQTPFSLNTAIVISWLDLDLGGAVVPGGNLLSVVVSDCPVGGDQTFGSLSFTLNTDTWSVNTYTLTVTINPSNSNYLGSSSETTVVIRIHYTSISVQTPEPTPWGLDTDLTITWTDLDIGGPVPGGQLSQVVVSDCPVGGDQTFSSLSFTLLTNTWALHAGYTLNVTVYATTGPQSYTHAVGSVLVAIRIHRVNVIANPPSPVPIGGSFTLYVEYYDLDLGTSIAIGEVSNIRVVGNDTGISYPDPIGNYNTFSILISTAGWRILTHQLNVTITPLDPNKYETGWDTVLVLLRKRNIVIDVDPIPSIPYQNDTLFTLRVNDSDAADFLRWNITSVVIQVPGYADTVYNSLNWDSAWNISTGVYLLPLPSSAWSLQQHNIRIIVNPHSTYKSSFTDTKATIRKLATSFLYTPPNPVPWDNDGWLLVTYIVQDDVSQFHLDPILAATITIAGWIEGTQFDYVYLSGGTYNITIYRDYIQSAQTFYYLDIGISAAAQYNSSRLDDVPLYVRELFTSLTYTQVSSQPFGDDVDITVTYIVYDVFSHYHHQDPIDSATLTVIGLDFTLGSNYAIIPLGGGQYIIRISSAVLSSIGSYTIAVNATLPPRYQMGKIANIPFIVRTVYSEVDKPPVDAVAYGDNFTITIIYRVRDDLSSQDGMGIPNADDIIVITNGSWTLNPGDWTITQGADGYYYISIDSDLTPYPAKWWIQITVGWTDPVPPYEEQVVTAWLISEYRPTRIVNTNPPDTGVGDFIEVYLNFTDINSGWGIDNTTTGDYLRIKILNHTTGLEISATYWVETYPGTGNWDEPSLYYRIFINASELGAVNIIFDFDIEVTWIGGNAPFYEEALKTFSVRTVGTETILYADAVTTQPTGDDLTIILHYNTSVGGLPVVNSSGNVEIIVECDDIIGWDHSYWYVPASSYPGTDGEYILIIDGSKNLAFGTYTFNVTLTWPTEFLPQYSPYYDSAQALVTGRVREIITSLDWTQSSEVFFSQQLYILANYSDIDHPGVIITDVTWLISEPLPYSFVQQPNGTWLITIDTSNSTAGAFSFYLTASKANYLSQVRDIDIQIKYAPINLSPVNYGSYIIEEYWGVPITVEVYLEFGLNSSPMVTNSIYFKWHSFDYVQMSSTGSDGYYRAVLDTSLVNATATQLFVLMNRTNFETGLLIYTVSIKQVETRLDIPSGDLTVLTLHIDDIFWLNVTFEGYNGTWYNIDSATIRAFDVEIYLDTFTPFGSGGFYNCRFNTSLWTIRTHSIIVVASSPNAVEQRLTFTVNILYKPCTITPENPTIQAEFKENVTLTVFLSDDLAGGTPITGDSLYFIWNLQPVYLIENGTPGWYSYWFIADDTPSPLPLVIVVYHNVFGKYSDSEASVSLVISKRDTELELISAHTHVVIDGIEHNITVPFSQSSWTLPIGDTLVLTFWYRDIDNYTLSDQEVRSAYFDFYGAQSFGYNPLTGYWTVTFLLDNIEEGECEIAFTSNNYFDQIITRTIVVTRIPMQISSEWDIEETLYVGGTYSFGLIVWDTYHGAGISDVDLDIILTGTLATSLTVQINADPVHPGIYNVTMTASGLGSGTITFSAAKSDYQSSEIQFATSLQFTPLANLLITGGSVGVVILIIALIGWIMWVRVYSIPWQVRRMRKLAKTIEKDESFELSRKDMKHFHAKEITLKDKLTSVMDTIGVAATPAMMPAIEEVEEITATEEDIMGELDKIPGLGPEEKAVLAEEMRKIPRKDRIWFLDDLRKQMGTRRMDFLTQKELGEVTELPKEVTPPPTEAPPAEAPPAEAPPEKKLEEVEAVEPPPPEKALTEDRTAPTVLPPEFQPKPVDPRIEAEIMQELNKIPGLEADEKQALLDHLKYLSKEERQATYASLRQSASRGD